MMYSKLVIFYITSFTFSRTVAFHVPQPLNRLDVPSSNWRYAPSSLLESESLTLCRGWVERSDGEWDWVEDDPTVLLKQKQQQEQEQEYASSSSATATDSFSISSSATPRLPSQTYRPKQSLGQNYLKDPNTVAKIIRAFHLDAMRNVQASSDSDNNSVVASKTTTDSNTETAPFQIVELGPGMGALTDKLVEMYGAEHLLCIEIDERSVDILQEKHPGLQVNHADVMQVDYSSLFDDAAGKKRPVAVIGNLPYYITSQILFALADASHVGSVQSATVTMQWEVAQRIVAQPKTKDYGILSVAFQLYADTHLHFKIPPTVFYPKPKVDSALVGFHFVTPRELQERLCGVDPTDFRRVVTSAFQQRRKTLRNSLRKLVLETSPSGGDASLLGAPPLPLPEAIQEARRRRLDKESNVKGKKKESYFAAGHLELPADWASKRAEELTAAQFVELTRLLFGPHDEMTAGEFPRPFASKVWRKQKHGQNELLD